MAPDAVPPTIEDVLRRMDELEERIIVLVTVLVNRIECSTRDCPETVEPDTVRVLPNTTGGWMDRVVTSSR